MDIVNIAYPIGDFLFAEAHWLFTFYYMRIAKNMPKVIDQSEEPQKEYRAVFWLGAVVNGVIAATEFSSYLWSKHLTNRLLEICVIVSTSGVFVCEIVTGFVLLYSVYIIFKYLHETENSQDRLNLQTLVIHSTSFGLFLVSNLIVAVFYSRYVFNHYDLNGSLISEIIDFVLSSISQCLLCAIFWVLSNQQV